MYTDSLLHVDVTAIGRNAEAFVHLAGPASACCGIVKADAYGLGARRVAPTLIEAGFSLLAVFRVEEALELLSEPLAVPVLVLGPVRGLSQVHPLAPDLLSGAAELVVHDQRQLEEVAHLARSGTRPIGIHIELDVGMRRGGTGVPTATGLVQSAIEMAGIQLCGVMSHFTAAGYDADTTESEAMIMADFLRQVGPLPAGCRVHAAATAAAVRDDRLRYDLVRIGLGWSGTVPGEASLGALAADTLTPAIRWRSRVSHVHRVSVGETVGYGGTWAATCNTIIGIVPLGYADGIPVSAGADRRRTGASIAVMKPRSGETPVGYAPIVGAVSMDQCAIDLGGCGGSPESLIGRELEVLSPVHDGPTSLQGFAGSCGMTPHQLLVGIGPRVRRVAVWRPDARVEQPGWAKAEAV